MTLRIAMEVAPNHIKLKPLDVETDSMERIRRYFTDLEFVRVESQLLASSNLELLGGRYCSVQSVPVVVNVKGISVRIWVEKGLLFALTEAAGLEPIKPGE